jgi:hypothetical protein
VSVDGHGCRTVTASVDIGWSDPSGLRLLYPAAGSTLQDTAGRPVARIVRVYEDHEYAFTLRVVLKGLDCLSDRWSTGARRLQITYRETGDEGHYVPDSPRSRWSPTAPPPALRRRSGVTPADAATTRLPAGERPRLRVRVQRRVRHGPQHHRLP